MRMATRPRQGSSSWEGFARGRPQIKDSRAPPDGTVGSRYRGDSWRLRTISAASRSRRRPATAMSQPAPRPATPTTTSPIQNAEDHSVTTFGGPADAKNLNARRLFEKSRSPGTRSISTEIVWVPVAKFHDSTRVVFPSRAFRYGTVGLARTVVTP